MNILGLRSSKLLGNGSFYVVFDCKHPSYLDTSKKKQRIEWTSELMRHRSEEIKSRVDGRRVMCDLPTNVWKEAAKESRLLVYNPHVKRFNYTLNENLLKYVLRLDNAGGNHRVVAKTNLNESLIVSILKVYHHPRFFY